MLHRLWNVRFDIFAKYLLAGCCWIASILLLQCVKSGVPSWFVCGLPNFFCKFFSMFFFSLVLIEATFRSTACLTVVLMRSWMVVGLEICSLSSS